MHICSIIRLLRDAGTQERYQQVYYYIEENAPYLLELMKDKKRRQEFDALIAKVCGAYIQSGD